MNTNELKAQIVRHGDTSKALAEAMGIAETTLSCKLNGRRDQCFTQFEIQFIINRYNLTADEVMLIFFAPEVSSFET